MGSWYRSEEMEYVELIISEDAAHECVRQLGQLGCIQFTDLNTHLTPFQRRFVAYVKRCDEIERKIRYFNIETKKMGIPVQSAGSIDIFVDTAGVTSGRELNTGAYLLDTLESKLERYEKQLLELNSFSEKLTGDFNQKLEYHQVLVKSRQFFVTEVPALQADSHAHDGFSPSSATEGSLQVALLDDDIPSPAPIERELRFSHITGVLGAEDRARFERMLFRATRGNCYVRFADIEEGLLDVKTGKALPAMVFIIFYKSAAIEIKIKRICDAFNAHRYHIDSLDNTAHLDALQQQNHRDMQEARIVLDKNTETRLRLCVELSQHIEEWMWTVKREKAVYYTLNLFKSDVSNLMRGQGWILKAYVDQAKAALYRAHANLSLPMTSLIQTAAGTWPTPPTWFHTNKYTYAFQEFVNTYGTPRYREINPALYTSATFPFLFGIMYADIGHGCCLTIAALYLVLTEKNAEQRGMGEMMKGMYTARYMLLLMGLMAVYCGIIYNDYFSLGLDLFGTRFHWLSYEKDTEAEYKTGGYGDLNNVYPIGVDPAWKIASNELLFFNSLKMKVSVIIGIIQMCFGIMLRGLNALYFNSMLDFCTEFLPMIFFAVSMFGYMVLVIFMKWGIDWDFRMLTATCTDGFKHDGSACNSTMTTADLCPLDYGGDGDGCQPPNLITTLINIALTPGSVTEPMYKNQANVQLVILGIAFIAVPVLLCAKPCILSSRSAKKPKVEHDSMSDTGLMLQDTDDGAAAEQHEEHEDHGFGELMIHQAIETIEFVLGMVSNTASYLRLWALSLAHTELAKVFWEKAMLSTINMNNGFFVFAGFGVFAAVTIGVLLMMDVLECFLHALRLHWVEFQNKFYKADGYKFQPFSFRTILEKASLE